MSIRDVCRRRKMTYDAKRDVQTSIMASNKESETKQNKAFKMFQNGLVNLEIADLLNITYQEVMALRIAYERRCQR